MNNRRDFLKLSGATVTGTVLLNNLPSAAAKPDHVSSESKYTPGNIFFNADHAPYWR